MCAAGVLVRIFHILVQINSLTKEHVKYTHVVYWLERIFLNQRRLLAKNVGLFCYYQRSAWINRSVRIKSHVTTEPSAAEESQLSIKSP